MSSLKDKLEEFIEGIKSKLPGRSDDDDYDDEYEEDEFDEKTEEINVKQSTEDSDEDIGEEDDDDDEEEDDEEAEKKKKKQMIMRGLIGVIALYLAYDTFLGTPQEEVVAPAPNFKRPKRAKRKKPRTKKVQAVDKAKEEAKVAQENPAPAQEATPAPAPTVDPVPAPVEQPKNDQVVEAPKVEEQIKIEEPNELSLKNDTPSVPLPTPVEPSMGENKMEEPNVVGQVDNSGEQGKSDLDKTLDKLSDDSPKIIEKFKKEKLEYQAPPSYLETGRGLIYNCVGKHWACVDKDSYMKCKKNADWSKENQKSPECFPAEVYRNFLDCRSIQIDKINTLAETSFCK